MNDRLRVALYQPDIAGNTGTILRFAACLGLGVDIIEPAGFPLSDRALKRAGMDYIEMADLTRHADWHALQPTHLEMSISLASTGSCPTRASGAMSSEAERRTMASDG